MRIIKVENSPVPLIYSDKYTELKFTGSEIKTLKRASAILDEADTRISDWYKKNDMGENDLFQPLMASVDINEILEEIILEN